MTCWSIGSRHQRTLGYFLLARLSPTLTSLMTLPLASAVWNKGSLGCFLSAKLSPTFGSFCLALIGALVRSVCDNICLAFKETFGLTVLLQELLCRIAPASSSRDSASSQLSACHRLDHPPRPHRRSCGRRRPHPYTAFAVEIRHFSCSPTLGIDRTVAALTRSD